MQELLLSLVVATAPLQTQSRQMMGTQVNVTLAASASDKTRAALDKAFAAFERIEEVMNEWRPESVLSEINRSAGTGEAVKAPQDLCEVLKLALDGAARTNGLFDPTWAALRDLWRFGTDRPSTVPTAEKLAEVCPLVRYQDVTLVPLPPPATGCSVALKRKGMRLGLGGLAKGYGVDQAARTLRALGFQDFYVQAGGDLFASGRNGKRRWRVGIRDPRRDASTYFAALEVENAAFSTSGDYERFFMHEAKRYHHLIDPRTCLPASRSRAVSILAKSAVEAEILSKAAFIAGGKAGLELVQDAGAAAVIVTGENHVLVSPQLRRSLKVNASPAP